MSPERAGIARTRAAAGGEKGFALVLVLMLVVILSMAVAAMALRTSGGYSLSRSRADGWKMHFAALTGVEEAKASLWRELSMGSPEPYFPADEPALEVKEPEAAPVAEEGNDGGEAAPAGEPAGPQTTAPGIYTVPEPLETEVDGVSVTVTFIDEAGKFPLNGFASGDETSQKELALGLARLFELLSLPNSTSLAGTLRDYIDLDKEGQREAGSRNIALFHLSQLAAAPGVDYKTIFLPNREGLPAASELLSVWHTGKVNVNTADRWVLRALAPTLTETDAAAIIAAREQRPFRSGEELTRRAGIPGDVAAVLARKVAFTTDTLTLRVEARYGEYARRIEAVVWVDSSTGHTLFLRDGWEGPADAAGTATSAL